MTETVGLIPPTAPDPAPHAPVALDVLRLARMTQVVSLGTDSHSRAVADNLTRQPHLALFVRASEDEAVDGLYDFVAGIMAAHSLNPDVMLTLDYEVAAVSAQGKTGPFTARKPLPVRQDQPRRPASTPA